jgi:hypothetical protein
VPWDLLEGSTTLDTGDERAVPSSRALAEAQDMVTGYRE